MQRATPLMRAIIQVNFMGYPPDLTLPACESSWRKIKFNEMVQGLAATEVCPLQKLDTVRTWLAQTDSDLTEAINKENLNTFDVEQLVHRIFGDGQYLQLALHNLLKHFPKISDSCLAIIREELGLLGAWCEAYGQPLSPKDVNFYATGLSEFPDINRIGSYLKISEALNEWADKMQVLLTFTELFVEQSLSTIERRAA